MADRDFPFIKTGIALHIAGGMIERNAAQAVASTPSEAHKAEFQAWTTGGALSSDVGAGMIVYGIYKRSPFWGAVAGLGWLALSVKMTGDKPEKTLSTMDRWGGGSVSSPPARTGWEPWGRRDWDYRDWDWDRHRWSRFGTLGDVGTAIPSPPSPPVTYTPTYMPHTAPPTSYVPRSVDLGPGF